MHLLWDTLEELNEASFKNSDLQKKAIQELSRYFTEDRKLLSTNYFKKNHLLAAYLTYFLPLNFHKALLLLRAHAKTLDLNKERVLICDFGCGPATATLAFLAYLSEQREKPAQEQPFKVRTVEIHLVDAQKEALDVAKKLISAFAKKLKINVDVKTHTEPPQKLTFDLSLVLNVLNELPTGETETDALLQLWQDTAGGYLIIEPSHRVSSQRLVRFRERLLSVAKEEAKILGPCTHQEKCPVNRTKHWCHFSEPTYDDQMIQLSLQSFDNPRLWLKFSYLFLQKAQPTPWDQKAFRAIGDLHPSGPGFVAIDLCQPNTKKVLKLPQKLPAHVFRGLVRGALVQMDGNKFQAKPIVKRLLKR